MSDRDAAWASFLVPLSGPALRAFLDQPETLFRINSLFEVRRWENLDDGRIALSLRNLVNDALIETAARVTRDDDSLCLHYEQGLKSSTCFQIESAGADMRVKITDDYSALPEEERRRRQDEVDRSLPRWGEDLQRFFIAWSRWSWLPPWRWYMRRVWLRMKPSARRITQWIVWITIAELVAFLLVVLLYRIESGG